MNMKRSVKSYITELLLYSGQYALFYITMQLIIEKQHFLLNAGHMILAATLLIQTYLLSKGYSKLRIMFVFLTPLTYSLIEASEGFSYLLNTAHIVFWVFASICIILKLVEHRDTNNLSKTVEYLYVVLNISIFLFLYFYFDTWKEIRDPEQLTIFQIGAHLSPFLEDPTHWYIIFGGILLSSIIAIGKNEVFRLNESIILLFGKYVDENVRDTIISKGEYTSETKELCILFSDIKNFTKLCEKHDASTISKMLNVYFDFWEKIASENNGTIDKYIGDAIMIIFGLEKNDRACNDAISCALQITENRESLNNDLEKNNLPVPEGFGIGCHYGELIIGDIGSKNRKNFTVIGDTVNVASRLESVNRKTSHNIIISEKTYLMLSDTLKEEFSRIGTIKLKGKESLTTIWGEK